MLSIISPILDDMIEIKKPIKAMFANKVRDTKILPIIVLGELSDRPISFNV